MIFVSRYHVFSIPLMVHSLDGQYIYMARDTLEMSVHLISVFVGFLDNDKYLEDDQHISAVHMLVLFDYVYSYENNGAYNRSEERRVGKECVARWEGEE